MNKPQFDLEGVEFRVEEPMQVRCWPEIQELRHSGYEAALPSRSSEEIAHLTQRDALLEYVRGCIRPDLSGRLSAGQSFANLTVATARLDGKMVGYGYAADNVSGRNGVERWFKMRSDNRRYAWLREIVVDPSVQHRGIARTLGVLMLDHFGPNQPVSAYTWQENAAAERLVRSFGLEPDTDDEGIPKTREVRVFGETAKPAEQIRWSHNTVDGVHRNILGQPGAQEAVCKAAGRLFRHKPD